MASALALYQRDGCGGFLSITDRKLNFRTDVPRREISMKRVQSYGALMSQISCLKNESAIEKTRSEWLKKETAVQSRIIHQLKKLLESSQTFL